MSHHTKPEPGPGEKIAFTKSIRWRLQLWVAFLLVSVLTGFGVTVYQLQRLQQFKQIDEELARRVAAVSGEVRTPRPPGFPGGGPGMGPRSGRPPFDDRPPPSGFDDRPDRRRPGRPDFRPPEPGERRPGGPRERMPREIRISVEVAALFAEAGSFYFAVWSRDGDLLKSSENAPVDLPLPERPVDTLTHTRMRLSAREAYHYTEMGECILAGRNISGQLTADRRFQWLLLIAGGGVLAGGLGMGWWLSGRAIKPVEDISAAARRISAGNLAERINVAETDNELGRLAGVLNSTFARLEAAFAQQKQFTADASHELRTPLAVLIAETQTTLTRDRSAAEYRETVEGCLTTAQQMRRLTDSLLALARVDAGQEQIKPAAVDLAAEAAACVQRLSPLAAARGVLIKQTLEPAQVWSTEGRLNQVLTNLLTNAIHYNRENGEIRVQTLQEGTITRLLVADTGEGIARDDQPHIFERFYRADKARTRASGQVGLGLAICKAIIEGDGGQIRVESQVGVGTTFTVEWPAPAPPERAALQAKGPGTS